MKTWLIVALVEAVALAIGFVFWHFSLISGWIVPLFLLAPPIIVIIVTVVFFAGAQGRGENPFQ